MELYRQAADQGYPMGRCNLGVMYFFGQGVEKDQKRRHTASAQAAEQRPARGPVPAGRVLRIRRRRGAGRIPALALYREAADAGYPDAQCALGVLYRLGKGVAQDHRRQPACSARAAEGGCPRACTSWD